MPRLGELEAAVMEVLWSAGTGLTVREVRDRLPPRHQSAYTTVMTVLVNLLHKSVVEREAAGRAYRYRAALSREGVVAASLREILNASDDPRSVLLHFAETVSEEESTVLRHGLARRTPPS
jgi:predicted transcriptional regulator